MLAATAQAAEIAELNRKLRLSDEELDRKKKDEELDRTNKRFKETQGVRCVSISRNYVHV